MITAFLLVLGCLVGAAFGDELGATVGAFVAYMFGHWLSESRKRDKLEARLREIETRLTLIQTELRKAGERTRVDGISERPITTAPPSSAQPTTGRPTSGLPGNGQPTADRPADLPATEQPTADRLADLRATEQPTADRLADLRATEQPTADRPADLPATEQPTAGRPTTDEPATGRPPIERPTEQPATGRPPGAPGRTEIRVTALPSTARAPFEDDFVPHVPASAKAPVSSAPSAFAHLRAWFFGGNTVVRVGIIILLFGVGFLVKFAAERSMFPVEARLACAVALGIALLVIGFRLRDKRLAYAVSLQGGGIGIIYLVTFASLKIYHFIPAPAALAVFVALGIFTGVLSVLQDAMALAVLGIIGGFLAPILASTGSGDHVALFTYYAILNAGILGLAWFKSWRVLNLIGFSFTFVIGSLWGFSAYTPENYLSTQLFLALFFVFYAAIAVIYALRRPAEHRGFVDGTLTFGLPAVVFSLQVGLVVDTPWGLAISAVVLAAFYITVATIVWQRSRAHGRRLAEAFAAIGVVFVTMALPFALNAQWTAAAYALEGAGLVWIGRRQNKPLAELAGVFLQFAAGMTFDTPSAAEASQPIIDRVYPYALLRAVGAIASAYFLRTRLSQIANVAQGALVIWAFGWLTGGVAADCLEHGKEWHFVVIMVSAAAAHALVLELLSAKLTWKAGRLGALLLGPLMLALVLIEQIMVSNSSKQTYTWIAWSVAITAWLVIIKRQENETYAKVMALAYAITPSLAAVIVATAAYLRVSTYVPEGVWAPSALAIAPAIILITVLVRDKAKTWPATTHDSAVFFGCPPIIAFIVLWSFIMSFSSSGNSAPLSYVPLLAPLDVTQAFIVVASAAWARSLRARSPEQFAIFRVPLASVLTAVLFVHLSAVCVRSVHFYAGVPWSAEDLMASQAVQATLSIAWTVIALVVTTLASRQGLRAVWLVGGGLLAIVVIKLFAVDLSSIGTGTRIISFLVVGLLLLLIGWISPVPPRTAHSGTL